MAKVKLLDPADPRRRLDRYELIGEIATGGMATVFLARLGGVGGFQRFVAIKRLHPHLANEQEFVEMFLDEARLAALIHHPHVVPILEVGVSDSGYYIVMEYVEGDTLSKIVARSMANGTLVPRPILVRIMLDTLHGLHAAHELTDERGQLLGLVHRDVSPQNVLVGVDGSSRITDFGVARATSRLTSTGSGKLKGKLAYMAPEQTRGDELDRRTDVFAAGIILWEILAGRRLFKADSEAATLNRILVEKIKPPSVIALAQAAPPLPPQFDQVALKALDRDASNRYQNAAELADALEKAALDSAKHSATDVGIASPRDVASFVQTILGQEIGAQRESVRAWLAQSDSANPKVSSIPAPPSRRRISTTDAQSETYRSGETNRSSAPEVPPPVTPMADVTMRFALDEPAAQPPLARAEAPRPPPPAKQSRPTLLGQGPLGPPSDRPSTKDLAVAMGAGDLGDLEEDAVTVARGSPYSAEALAVDLAPQVKTARGLFAADLIEHARIQANGRRMNNVESGTLAGVGPSGFDTSALAASAGVDASTFASETPAPQRLSNETPSALTSASMTLPSSSYSPAGEYTEMTPRRRNGGAKIAIIAAVFLLVFGVGFVVVQMQTPDVPTSSTPDPEPPKAAKAATSDLPTPPPLVPTDDSATTSASAKATAAPLADPRRPYRPNRPRPTAEPARTSTGAGDDLTNPYR